MSPDIYLRLHCVKYVKTSCEMFSVRTTSMNSPKYIEEPCIRPLEN